MKAGMLAAVAVFGLTAGAMAEPVTGKVAKGALFAPQGAQARIVPQILNAREEQIIEQAAMVQKYYGAVALSPDEGLMSEATVAAANFHDLAAAHRVALAACDAKRVKASKPCVIVADIVPSGWVPGRPVQLSQDATAGFEGGFMAASAPRAFAISPETGHWGHGVGRDAALAACAAMGGAKDCEIIIQD